MGSSFPKYFSESSLVITSEPGFLRASLGLPLTRLAEKMLKKVESTK